MSKKPSGDQIAELAMFAAKNLSVEEIQAIIEKRVEIKGEKCDLITVPCLSAAELVARAKEKLNLTYLDEAGYASYDFVRDEGGKTFEVLTWKPGRCVETEEVRKHFADLGADGNAAAFMVWITEEDPEGYHASVPSDDSRLYRRPQSGGLCAPYFSRNGHARNLSLRDVRREWHDDYSFVALPRVQ